jgi:hypothetical protein
MANIAISGGFGAAGGALSGGLSGAASGGGVFSIPGAIIGAIVGAVIGAGSAAAQMALAANQNTSPRKVNDAITTQSIRNIPVAVVYGRGRVGGNWIECGEFEQVKDFEPNVPPGTVQYLQNAILGLCEGPVATMGNIRQDGQLLSHWVLLKNLPWQYIQYIWNQGLNTDTTYPFQASGHGYQIATANQIPFRNTSSFCTFTYTGPILQPRLVDVNVDLVGCGHNPIIRSGTTSDSANDDIAVSVIYDGYSEAYYYTLASSGASSSPFGMASVGRRGGTRTYTQPPSGVSTSIGNAWYLGRHDILVFQDTTDSGTFYIGYWGIAADSPDWEVFKPGSPMGGSAYEHAIEAWCLDERYGILHTLHDDGSVRYILKWNLLSGRIDRLVTDLPTAETWQGLHFSPDLGAYLTCDGTTLRVVSGTGETIRSTTSVPNLSGCVGLLYTGTQIGVISPGNCYYYDFFNGNVSGPFGDSLTNLAIGSIGDVIGARQNTWTGHVTVFRQEDSGCPVFINFIASCMEDIRDINANGSSGTGTYNTGGGTPELDFQNIANLSLDVPDEPYYPQIFEGTGNLVGNQGYPPNYPPTDWIRDWSYRQYNAWSLTALQGNSSLAASIWNSLVDEPCNDSGRWGGGLSDSYFSLSSFEAVHAYCVGPITVLNPSGIDTRVCERFKFDYVLDKQIDLASFVTQEALVCCQGYHYTMGGILYIDVPRPGLLPMWHFSDRQINEGGTFKVNFIPKADGINRVRVMYRDVLDEYRHDYAEAEDLADINARGRVQMTEVTADGCGRFASADLLAKQILDQSTAGRRQVTFKTHYLGLILMPGDVIEISNKQCGLNRMISRVLVVKEETDGNATGAVEIQAIEAPPTLDVLDSAQALPAAPGDDVSPVDASGGIELTVTSSSNQITWLSNGSAFTGGTYTIEYTSGAYTDTQHSFPYATKGFEVVTQDGTGNVSNVAAIPYAPEPGEPWATLEDCETANAGQYTSFSLVPAQGNRIGVRAPNYCAMCLDDEGNQVEGVTYTITYTP